MASKAVRARSMGLLVVEQAGGVVVAQGQALELEGELLAGRCPRGSRPRRRRSRRPWRSRRSQSRWSATRASRIGPGWSSNSIEPVTKMQPPGSDLGLPAQPALEQLADPLLAAGHGQGRPDGGVDEPLARVLQGLQLELLLGLEVGEQPALAHPGLLGQLADGQPGEADARGEGQRLVEDRLLVSWPLLMRKQNRTTVLFWQGLSADHPDLPGVEARRRAAVAVGVEPMPPVERLRAQVRLEHEQPARPDRRDRVEQGAAEAAAPPGGARVEGDRAPGSRVRPPCGSGRRRRSRPARRPRPPRASAGGRPRSGSPSRCASARCRPAAPRAGPGSTRPAYASRQQAACSAAPASTSSSVAVRNVTPSGRVTRAS